LIHRDIKPGNVWLEAPKGRVKILDFGLARDASDEMKLTHSGAVIGTPAYMSPEQASGEILDQRSDLFSLGIVLYELVTGQLPFRQKTVLAMMRALKDDPHPPIAAINPQVPTGLVALIDQLLAKEPHDRPQSAVEVVEALAELEKPATRPDGKPVPEVVYLPMATSVVDPFADIDATESKTDAVSRDAESSERSAGPAKRSLPGRSAPLRKASASRLTGRAGIAAGALVLLVAGFFVVRSLTSNPPPASSIPEPNAVVAKVVPKVEPVKKPPVVEPLIDRDPKGSVAPPPIVKGKETTYDLGNGVKLDVIKIAARGKSFLMRSPKDEPDRANVTTFDPEKQHEVTFGRDFSMGKYEVTQEQYEAIMGMNPARFKGAKNPVEGVSWEDAEEFMEKLNEKFKGQKVKFRLPSEAVWEYACRAGTTTEYNTGNTLTIEQAAFDIRDNSGPKAVGTYAANAFGLHDMHGDVYEWCEDYCGPYSNAPMDGTAQTIKKAPKDGTAQTIKKAPKDGTAQTIKKAPKDGTAQTIRQESDRRVRRGGS